MSPGFPRDIRPTVLKTHHSLFAKTTGLSPSTVPRSSGVSLSRTSLKRWFYYTTSPLAGIQFGLCCVHSPLLTASRFDFFSCPYADVSTQGVPLPLRNAPKKMQEFPLGNPRIKGSMRLPVAYRSLARPSSVLEPSHPPNGIATPKDKLLSCPKFFATPRITLLRIQFQESAYH